MYRVKAILLQIRKAREVICQRLVDVPMQIMVTERRKDSNLAFPPDCGFTVIHFPVSRTIPVVGDITAKHDEVWTRISNRQHQLLADGGVRCLNVAGVSEPGIAISNEAEVIVNLGLEF